MKLALDIFYILSYITIAVFLYLVNPYLAVAAVVYYFTNLVSLLCQPSKPNLQLVNNKLLEKLLVEKKELENIHHKTNTLQ